MCSIDIAVIFPVFMKCIYKFEVKKETGPILKGS